MTMGSGIKGSIGFQPVLTLKPRRIYIIFVLFFYRSLRIDPTYIPIRAPIDH
jgi:hypothetical protein